MNDVNLNPETQTDVSKLEVLISRQQLQERIRELGQKISADYKNKELDLVGVLKGGFIFLADLVRELEIPCRIHFLQASSYQDRKTSSGVVRLSHDLQLSGKHVMVVEDIYDTGLTLKRVFEDLQSQSPASLEICTLLSKKIEGKVPLDVKYTGFESRTVSSSATVWITRNVTVKSRILSAWIDPGTQPVRPKSSSKRSISSSPK